MTDFKRIVVLTGAFGSGKTELALNLCLHYAKNGEAIALADLDLINPVFKSSSRKEMLLESGVRVISPIFAMTAVDVPALPAEVSSVFYSPNERCVIDVGGDENGAVALGRYVPDFTREPPEVLLVVNARRPMSATLADLEPLQKRIAQKSGLFHTGLVNNTNLQGQTTAEDILRGQDLLDELTQATGLPTRMVCAIPELKPQLPERLQSMFFPITRKLLPIWEDSARGG